MFDGLVLGTNEANNSFIYLFCSKYFDSLVKLMHSYQNCPQVVTSIFQFFTSFIKLQDFSKLALEQKHKTYQTLVELFKSVSMASTGKSFCCYNILLTLLSNQLKFMHMNVKECQMASAIFEEHDEPFTENVVLLDLLYELIAHGNEVSGECSTG